MYNTPRKNIWGKMLNVDRSMIANPYIIRVNMPSKASLEMF